MKIKIYKTAFLLCLFSFNAFALDLSSPIDIFSDNLEVSPDKQHAVFKGNVKVKHDGVSFGASEVSVVYGSGGEDIKEVTANGKVVIVNGNNVATGDKAVYNPVTGNVVLTGNVILSRDSSVLKGGKLIYDLKTGHMSLDDLKKGGRVKATFSLKRK